MKRLKKILALTLALVTSVFFTGCGSATLSKDGNYWFSDPSASFKALYKEVCEYDVTVTSTTFSSSTEVTNPNGVVLEITSGKLTTTLETREGAGSNRYYLYTTVLNVSGNYRFPGEPQKVEPFTDSYTTVTKFGEDLVPITSTKTQDNNTLLVTDQAGYGLLSYKYSYAINYEGTNANVTLTEYDEQGAPHDTQNTFKKYTKGAYIDNNTLFLIPRLYNLTSGFSRTFKTIDVLGNVNRDMMYYVPTEEVDVKNMPAYELNGIVGEQVPSARLSISIQDTYSGAVMECYYAVNKEVDRHRLTRSYIKINDSLGYLCYTLKKVTITE
ncbi:MAG: hypothetical protein IKL82_04965 [Clostridia bacterium]|nr:hypothetical protein [Clostridia bacterium]